ncbi:MAG: putative toxin-antitoxin system toxin component, PIN family [Gammaproteobacteria bacterium]
MGPKREVKLPRVVLDTNTVISALLFKRGKLIWLRHAWQAGRFVPLINHDTASELVRVLGYPKFELTRAEQETLLAEFLPFAEVVSGRASTAGLPKVRDPDDIMFLALARHAKADALVSGDADLQAVRDKLQGIPILSPAKFSGWLENRSADTKRSH